MSPQEFWNICDNCVRGEPDAEFGHEIALGTFTGYISLWTVRILQDGVVVASVTHSVDDDAAQWVTKPSDVIEMKILLYGDHGKRLSAWKLLQREIDRQRLKSLATLGVRPENLNNVCAIGSI